MEVTKDISERKIAQVAALAGLGSYLDYFDFFISIVASGTVWPIAFFKGLPVNEAYAVSLLAFAVTYFVRPIGGVVFGHVGDTAGRRKGLSWNLIIIGLGSLGIALMPGVSAVGAGLAAVGLMLMRVVQGIGFGGEFGGAASWIGEFAQKSKWRTFWQSWTLLPVPLGSATSGVIFALMSSTLPRAEFLDWGWRVIFVIGFVVSLVGAGIRYSLGESPMFQAAARNAKERVAVPISELFREKWKTVLLMMLLVMTNIGGGTIVTPLALQYLIALHVPLAAAALAQSIGYFLSIPVGIVVGIWASRSARKKLFLIGGYLWLIVTLYPFFYALGTKNISLIPLMWLLNLVGGTTAGAVIPSLFTEAFPTKYRYTGSGLAYQFGSVMVGIIVTLFYAPVLLLKGPIGTVPYMEVFYTILTAFQIVLAIFFIKDRKELPE